MEFVYKTRGTCSTAIKINVEDGIVQEVVYSGGCNGNLKGIGSLVKGMPVDDVIARLEGLTCGFKSTSCPDLLAKALKQYKEQN